MVGDRGVFRNEVDSGVWQGIGSDAAGGPGGWRAKRLRRGVVHQPP